MPAQSKYKGTGEGNRAPLPVHFGVGRGNIRVSMEGSEAALGRDLNNAFRTLAQDFRFFTDKLEEDVLPEEMRAALEPTFEKSQEYCPKLTGALVESGYLEVESFRGGARVEMGYGRGGDPPYAIYVHEVPANHLPPTRDKFLQAAVEEDYFQILNRIADNVRMRLGL